MLVLSTLTVALNVFTLVVFFICLILVFLLLQHHDETQKFKSWFVFVCKYPFAPVNLKGQSNESNESIPSTPMTFKILVHLLNGGTLEMEQDQSTFKMVKNKGYKSQFNDADVIAFIAYDAHHKRDKDNHLQPTGKESSFISKLKMDGNFSQ